MNSSLNPNGLLPNDLAREIYEKTKGKSKPYDRR